MEPPSPRSAVSAANALARSFASEIVGTIVPGVPRAGEYAMSLTMKFTTFVTMELRIDANLTGAMRLTLAPDGTASACLGARKRGVVAGQRHYEPQQEKRQHRESDDRQLVVLAGKWTIVDGVANIDFDRIGWNSCDITKATSATTEQLRCIAIEPTERVPVAGLACEVSERSKLLELGMPMNNAAAKPDGSHNPPRGRHLILGAPGVSVHVDQGRRAVVPVFTFGNATVTLVEADYRVSP